MDLILLRKIENLGGIGDKVSVRAGYGRNYLLPQGMALRATPANLEVFESQKADLLKASEDRVAQATARATELATMAIEIEAHSGPGGKLFGSVGPAEIADTLTAKGVEVEKSEVRMPEGPIRQVGEFEVGIHLHAEIDDVNVTVTVVEMETA